jgi:hypothetical protein
VAISEEHFIGFDPTLGAEQLQACPQYPYAALVVWYERWFFTSWSAGSTHDTGIVWSHGMTIFDPLGNVMTDTVGVTVRGCGFTGNTTCHGEEVCPSNDEWLAKARASCAHFDYPPAGTVELVPGFAAVIGRKHAD